MTRSFLSACVGGYFTGLSLSFPSAARSSPVLVARRHIWLPGSANKAGDEADGEAEEQAGDEYPEAPGIPYPHGLSELLNAGKLPVLPGQAMTDTTQPDARYYLQQWSGVRDEREDDE